MHSRRMARPPRGMLMTILARYAGADTDRRLQTCTRRAWRGRSRQAFRWPRAGGWHYTRAARHHVKYRYADVPGSRRHTDAFATQIPPYAYAVDAMRWAAANGIVNGSARQAESTGECHPRTGRGNADAVLWKDGTIIHYAAHAGERCVRRKFSGPKIFEFSENVLTDS